VLGHIRSAFVANRHFCAGTATGIGLWRIDVKPTDTQWWESDSDKFRISFLRGRNEESHSSYQLNVPKLYFKKDCCLGWDKFFSNFVVDDMGSAFSQDESSQIMIKLQYMA
jgi:hypothetical protein